MEFNAVDKQFIGVVGALLAAGLGEPAYGIIVGIAMLVTMPTSWEAIFGAAMLAMGLGVARRVIVNRRSDL